MSKIRVTYSGLIAFAVRLVSIFTGFIFILIVTRQLTEQEFGTWTLVGSLIAYVVIIEPVISYWVTRETARNTPSGKTAVGTSGIFSIGAIFAYILISFLVGHQSDADVEVLFFAVILVPLMFIDKTLRGINSGWRPHVNSYGFLVIEITKIPIAFYLLYFMNMGVKGAIIATTVGYAINVGLLAYYARPKIKSKFRILFVRKWFKLSWLPLYREIPVVVFLSDVIIFSIITGSVIGIAYITAARAVTSIVAHTSAISRGVYPKLLEGGKQEYLQENLMRVLFFAIPFTALTITFARPVLYALNPIYEIAVPIVLLLAPRTFFSTINKVLWAALQGIEKIDVKESATFKEYIKSKLFLIPTLRMIQYGSYVALLIIVLFIMTSEQSSQLDMVIVWAIIGVSTEIPFFVYTLYLTKKYFSLKLDLKSLLKYSLTTILVFSGVYYLMENFLEYSQSIFEFLPNLLVYVILAALAYIGLTYLIDSRTKLLFKSIINEVFFKSKHN